MPKQKIKTERHPSRRRCNYCGKKGALIWVHGHGQCAHCGINVEDCCQGDQIKAGSRPGLNKNQ